MPATDPRAAPDRRALLLAWAAAALTEAGLAQGTAAPPPSWVTAAEVGLLMLVGAAHARFARPGPSASLAAPAALLIASSVARSGFILDEWRWLAVLAAAPLAALAAAAAHPLLRRLPGLPTALALGLLGGVGARGATLGGSRMAEPHLQLLEDLEAPLRAARGRPQGPATPPVVVLTIDTLRADHAVRTRTWARLVERGAGWPTAMSTASWTLPSVASMWTGLLPAEHGAGSIPSGGFSSIHAHVPTLAEQAQAAGWDTAAFVVNPFVSSALGFKRGFRRFQNADEEIAQPLALLGARSRLPARDGAQVVDHALRWLDGAPETGWLLWVHLFDPHLPYAHIPEDHIARRVKHPKQLRSGKIKATPRLKKAVAEAYQLEVEYADTQMLRMLDALEARGFFEAGGTLVFTSDHGEELWEHNDFEHGHSHHREVTDVALAVVSPGIAPGLRAGEASLQDLTPTLRAAMGLPDPGQGAAGLDLHLPLPPDRAVVAAGNLYGAQQTSARETGWKAIQTRRKSGDRTCAYALAEDPDEDRCLSEAPPEAARVTGLAAATGTAAEGATATDVNVCQLCALGYMSGPECEVCAP